MQSASPYDRLRCERFEQRFLCAETRGHFDVLEKRFSFTYHSDHGLESKCDERRREAFWKQKSKKNIWRHHHDNAKYFRRSSENQKHSKETWFSQFLFLSTHVIRFEIVRGKKWNPLEARRYRKNTDKRPRVSLRRKIFTIMQKNRTSQMVTRDSINQQNEVEDAEYEKGTNIISSGALWQESVHCELQQCT